MLINQWKHLLPKSWAFSIKIASRQLTSHLLNLEMLMAWASEWANIFSNFFSSIQIESMIFHHRAVWQMSDANIFPDSSPCRLVICVWMKHWNVVQMDLGRCHYGKIPRRLIRTMKSVVKFREEWASTRTWSSQFYSFVISGPRQPILIIVSNHFWMEPQINERWTWLVSGEFNWKFNAIIKN